MAKRITGIAIFPRESRNKIYYHTDELEKFDGLTVPLRHDHIEGEEGVIGTATFTYDPDKQQVKYEAEITDSIWQQLVDNEIFQVSIGATVEKQDRLCPENSDRDCLNAPILQSIDELSLVKTPGIPESTLTVIESQIDNSAGVTSSNLIWNNIANSGTNATFPVTTITQTQYVPEKTSCGMIKKDCQERLYTSNNPNLEKDKSMAEETSPKKEKVEEKVKVTIETDSEIEVTSTDDKKDDKKEEVPKEAKHQDGCPEGQHKVDGKCVPKPKESKPEVDVKGITEKVTEDVTSELTKAVREAWKPQSEVQESVKGIAETEAPYTDEEAKKIIERLHENGFVNIEIDKEDYIKKHTAQVDKSGKITEAVTGSGIPVARAHTNIIITKDGKTELSIRQWGQFESIPTGTNTARFYTLTVPNAGAITETVLTDISAASHTLTPINVTCAVRGWRQTILRSQFEDFPASFLNALRETARIESVRDEHRLIVQDIAGTDHDFGGLGASGIVPAHISADDGAAITDTTEEDAADQLLPAGLSLAKRELQVGFEPNIGPSALVAFLSPLAFENLYTATELSEYTMIGNPSVTRLGELEKIFGIDIVVTNELLVANNAFRNLLCVKGQAWALVSQRTMNIQLQELIASQHTEVVWTHRIGVDVLDANSYVIISGPNT